MPTRNEEQAEVRVVNILGSLLYGWNMGPENITGMR